MLAACSGAPGVTPTPVDDVTTSTTVPVTTGAPVTTTPDTGPVPDLPTTTISVGDTELDVWLADDTTERQQGLRGVGALPGGIDGMLFGWDTPTDAVFVMEDTLIPLDLWFFDGDGIMVGSHQMTPCTTDPCPRYPAPGPVLWALETPAGVLVIEEGERISTSASG